VSCAAANAVVAAIDDQLLASVRDNGARLLAGLAALPAVKQARGHGLLVGAVLDRPAQGVVDAALEAGLVTLTAAPDVLRLAPPLVVGPDEVDLALDILTEVLA
jgi:acetylornithine aminotransferase